MTKLASTQHDGGHLEMSGIAHMALYVPEQDVGKVIIEGTFKKADGRTDPGSNVRLLHNGLVVITAHLHNAFVNQGLQDVLDSAYGDLVADRITHIGLSADDQAVTATTVSLDPAGGATGTSIKVTANTARVNQTVSADQTWSQADVAWAIRKIGLLASSAATDVVNIIGGTAGAAPYDEPFNIDLTNIATWSLQMGIDVTATAS